MEKNIMDIEKPKDWPINETELQLENIRNQIDEFIDNPSYKNREVLVSLVTHYDLNQMSGLGLFRTTEYEVAVINSLYFDASFIGFNSLKVFLYELISNKTRMQKMISWFPELKEDTGIKEFDGLFPQLRLHYITYRIFDVEKSKSYAEQLIETVEENLNYLSNNNKKELILQITKAYISLLNDISYFPCTKTNKIWTFTRDEIYKLYKLVAKLNKIIGDNPTKRPLKGVLMTSISNYILKSRNNYNEDYICKYVSSTVAKQSIDNHQIWMSVIEKLNDDREQKVIPELFEKNAWSSYSWIKNIDFTPKRIYYVSSFCKTINDKIMINNYGDCIYGFKDDRIAELISPIMYINKKNKYEPPRLSQVITFDVLYNKEEAKEELEFLFSIIDSFDMTNQEKKSFLEDILQYWILSVKDEKWSYERERRYVIFLYDNYEYKEIDLSDSRFLKTKTSLLLLPDFILGNNPVKTCIKYMVDNKRKAISMKPYLYCCNCLNRDFDAVISFKKLTQCPICGSKNISIENDIEKFKISGN